MSTINILHISDLHWSSKAHNDICIVRDALLRDLDRLEADGIKTDLIIFSGDLVFSGSNPKDFSKAFETLLAPVLKRTGLTSDRLFLCPGNHDIDRDAITDYIECGLRANLKSNDVSNDFFDRVKSGDGTRKAAFDRLKNYNNWWRASILKKPPNIYSSSALQVDKFTLNCEKIGLATFNSAWRCTGGADDVDRNALVVGERNVDEAAKLISECDIKIAVFHHPTDWLADFDQSAILGRLYSEFDLLVHGHVHKALPEQRYTTSGTALISQAGCLYSSRKYPNSYQIVSIDLNHSLCTFFLRTYFDNPRREFDAALNVSEGGVFRSDFFGRKKADLNEQVRRTLREVGLLVRQKEATHLDIAGVLSGSGADARTTFVCPPLTRRKHISTAEKETIAEKDPEDEFVKFEDLLRMQDNLLFVASREGGKSSLANHVAVLTTEGLSDRDRIPFVVDYKAVVKGPHAVQDEFLTYYKAAPNRLDYKKLAKDKSLLLIVDNVDLQDLGNEQDLEKAMGELPGCRWVLFASATSFIGDTSRQALRGLVKHFHIRPLPRRAIREMSKRWCQITGNNDVEANNFIIRHVNDNNLPRTGYIVSLLMWAYQKQKKLERINEAFLLSAVIDSLLGKADFTKALRKEFDPTLAELTLQHLALYIGSPQSKNALNDIVIFLAAFFKKKSLNFNAGEVLSSFLECGILADLGNEIAFKYRCFQEFFVASAFVRSPQMLQDALVGDRIVRRREIYLYSGLRRQNEQLIDDLISRLQRTFPEKLKNISVDDYEALAKKRIYDDATKKKLTTIKTKKMTSEQVDDLLDTAEKEIDRSDSAVEQRDVSKDEDVEKEDVDAKEGEERGSISAYMTEVALLGMVIKNSEFDDGDVKKRALKFYLEKNLVLTVFMVRLMNEVVDKWFSGEGKGVLGEKAADEELFALKAKMSFVMEKILMTIMTLRVSDDVGSEKLGLAFKEAFDDAVSSPHDRLMLGMVMYDLDEASWEASFIKLVDENQKHPFVLDVITERLWHDLYTRFEPEERRIKISLIVDRIASNLGADGGWRKKSSRQAVDRAAYLTQTRDG